MDLKAMRQNIKNAGGAMGAMFYLKADTKRRVRFLQEFDEGGEVVFHDHYDRGINQPCLEAYDMECELCEDDELRTRPLYYWSVWDVESKEVKLMIYAANNYSPIPALMSMFDTYGTIMDRDYIIQQNGSGGNKSFTVVPMDPAELRNKKAKPFAEKKVLDVLKKAYLAEVFGDDDEDDEPVPKKKAKGKAKKKTEKEDELGDLTPKQLYKKCMDMDIDAAPRKKASYYIDLIEAADEEDPWDDDEGDDDDWD